MYARTVIPAEVHKISLVLDELVKKGEVDPKRIAMSDLSFGGFYWFNAAALEPRIQVVGARSTWHQRMWRHWCC